MKFFTEARRPGEQPRVAGFAGRGNPGETPYFATPEPRGAEPRPPGRWDRKLDMHRRVGAGICQK